MAELHGSNHIDRDHMIDTILHNSRSDYHHYVGTRYLHYVLIAPNDSVIGVGYAERAAGEEFVLDVAIAYASQEAKESARENLFSCNPQELKRFMVS